MSTLLSIKALSLLAEKVSVRSAYARKLTRRNFRALTSMAKSDVVPPHIVSLSRKKMTQLLANKSDLGG